MRNRVNQVYEKYWNYTAAFTDFEDTLFRGVLAACVEFIDAHRDEIYSPEKNKESWKFLQSRYPSLAKKEEDAWVTQRKKWNQLVKLGFIRPYLSGYPIETREYLSATTERKRKSILSKIVYKYANFLNSTTNDIHTKQLAFFIKSLEKVGSFSEIELATLMTIDINEFDDECVTKDDLARQYAEIDVENFYQRKYNQVRHMKSLLGKLEDLTLRDNVLYFKTDADRLFGDEETKKNVRDPYLQRVYKSELEEESCIHFECDTPKCMLEGLSHPVLIASHIKPYSDCKNDEHAQFDVNNGLLLSKNTDSLFDLGYMTFDNQGIIIPSRDLTSDMSAYLAQFRLHPDFINPKRMEYMDYHRNVVFEKRYSTNNVKKYIFQEDIYHSIAAEDTNIR
ncbi:MAG: HNH endonuclease signature motif containing protein [Bacteroidaceae bacterium]|nr:HNH endonuclease signature motif containing protein [Bacteroidaceae bacterium]